MAAHPLIDSQASLMSRLPSELALADVDPLGITGLGTADRVSTGDRENAVAFAERVWGSHRLEIVGDDARFLATLASVDIGPLLLAEVAYDAHTIVRREPLPSSVMIVIPLRARIIVSAGTTRFVAEPYRSMVAIGSRDAVEIEWVAGARGFVLRIDAAGLDDAAHLISPGASPVEVDTVPVSGASGFAIYGVVQMLARLVAEGGVRSAILRRVTHQALLTLALALAPPLTGEPDVKAVGGHRVREAMDLVSAEDAAHHTVTGIAAALGVSVRTLETDFHRELGIAPHGFLREARLARVREELELARRGELTVTAVASRWGFHHHGRFVTLYRARFGELPSATLRR